MNFMTVGQDVWESFVVREYLAPGGYVGDGNSQIKFVVGRPGSGKTHLLRRLAWHAEQLGYVVALLSAIEIRLQHIDSIYAAVVARVDVDELARRLARRAAQGLDYDLADVPEGHTFLEWVVRHHNRIDVIVRREVEEKLGGFFKQERVEPNFSLAFTQLASDILGTRPLSGEDRATLLRWLRGEQLSAAHLRHVHLTRRVDRHNARDMLHALAHFVRRQGYAGLFVAIDGLEDIAEGRNPATGRPKYGAVARADAYQSLREMVDEMPSISGLMVVLAGRTDFLELPRGIKSYDALWLRIQHEIVSTRCNRFAQVIDLDRAVGEHLKEPDTEELCERLSSLGLRARSVDDSRAREILGARAGEGVYRRLVREIVSDGREEG
ncbi:MAG: DUF2791 family P-loop domain-containing protein [Chloroflexi bacterium]|nr:DUF2791 family P-loop domain-containing protein [Chloroflexota bacterium]